MSFIQHLTDAHSVLMCEGRRFTGSDGKRMCEADVEDLVSEVTEELLIKEARGSGFDAIFGLSPAQYILTYFRRRAADRFKFKKVEYVSTIVDGGEHISSAETAYKNAAYQDEYNLSSTSEIILQCRDLCADAGIEFKLLVACAERMRETDLSAMSSIFAPLRTYAKRHSNVFEIIEDFLGLFSLPDFSLRDIEPGVYCT